MLAAQSHDNQKDTSLTDVSFLHLFFPEGNGAGSGIHGLDDGKRLQPIAQIAHPIAALLEALFDHDTQTLNGGLCRLHQGDQPLQRKAVGQKVIHDQHMIVAAQKFLGDHHLVGLLGGVRLHLSHIGIAVDVDTAGLLGKHQRHPQQPCHGAADGNAGGLDGQHLGNGQTRKAAQKLLRDLIDQRHVHLMIQKAVHLQHITFFDDTVPQDPFFENFHNSTSLRNYYITSQDNCHPFSKNCFEFMNFL